MLKSGAVDRLIYVRDVRATLTPNGRQVLADFKAEFSGEMPQVLVYGAHSRSLNHLSAMRRFLEIAASGDLTMYHPGLKKEHILGHDDAWIYLLDKHRWLENELRGSGMNTLAFEPRAAKLWFDENTMWVELTDGRRLGVPLAYFPRLLNATETQKEACIISGGGTGLHWDDLDEDISVKALLLGIGDQTRISRKAS